MALFLRGTATPSTAAQSPLFNFNRFPFPLLSLFDSRLLRCRFFFVLDNTTLYESSKNALSPSSTETPCLEGRATNFWGGLRIRCEDVLDAVVSLVDWMLLVFWVGVAIAEDASVLLVAVSTLAFTALLFVGLESSGELSSLVWEARLILVGELPMIFDSSCYVKQLVLTVHRAVYRLRLERSV
jgi:hypothetical protein